MSQQLERDVRFLKRYAAITTALMIIVSVGAFVRPARHEKFTEIDVERINVKEPDGKYRLVISNRARSIGPIYKGKSFGYAGGNRPGLIFFNDEGTENGGLTFTGSRCEGDTSITTGRKCTKGEYYASTHMSFDQYNQDQVLNLDYSDQNGRRLTGISVNDRADVDIYDMVKERDSIMRIADTAMRSAALRKWAGPRNGVPLSVQRMFVGRDPSKSAVLNLSDADGKPRLRLVVDSLGAARIEFLDRNGKVSRTLSDTTTR
jgi:hypothetical protein